MMAEKEMKPNTTDARIAVAAGPVKQQALDQAILHLEAPLEDQPRHEIALGMLASIHAQLGMHDRAIPEYRDVLEVNPGDVLARFQMGLCHLTAEDPARALEAWRPLLDEPTDFMAHFHSALALLQLQRSDGVRPLLERARERMPESHPLHAELLRLLAQ